MQASNSGDRGRFCARSRTRRLHASASPSLALGRDRRGAGARPRPRRGGTRTSRLHVHRLRRRHTDGCAASHQQREREDSGRNQPRHRSPDREERCRRGTCSAGVESRRVARDDRAKGVGHRPCQHDGPADLLHRGIASACRGRRTGLRDFVPRSPCLHGNSSPAQPGGRRQEADRLDRRRVDAAERAHTRGDLARTFAACTAVQGACDRIDRAGEAAERTFDNRRYAGERDRGRDDSLTRSGAMVALPAQWRDARPSAGLRRCSCARSQRYPPPRATPARGSRHPRRRRRRHAGQRDAYVHARRECDPRHVARVAAV